MKYLIKEIIHNKEIIDSACLLFPHSGRKITTRSCDMDHQLGQ